VGEREAFELFGEESHLRSSNHKKMIKREAKRVEALEARLMGDAGAP